MTKQILVIGASSTIGVCLIPRLLALGYDVIAQYNTNKTELHHMKLIHPSQMKIIQANFTDETSTKNFVSTIKDRGIFHSVVHLPSPPISIKPINRIMWSEFEAHLIIQLRSLQQVVNITLKGMKKNNDGRVISVSSEAIATTPTPKGFGAYAVAKAALNQYLKCLQAEVQSHNITVCQIIPGMFKSPLLANIPNYVVEKTISDATDTNSTSRQEKISETIISFIEQNNQTETTIFI